MTPRVSSRALNVLLVEDDEDDFLLVRDALRAMCTGKVTVEWVREADEALPALAAASHDVCLMDYRLGAHTGLELLEQARRQGWRTPIILLTGMTEGSEVDHQAQEAGAADFLAKSEVTPVLLERSIRYAIQHARTLEALRRSQASFRELIERQPDGITVLSAGRAVYVNPAMARLGGVSQEALLGQTLDGLMVRLLGAEEWPKLQETLEGQDGPMAPREARLLRPSGEAIPVELARLPVVFDGQPCSMWIARDLTERKLLQSRLMLAERMASLGMVAGTVAHDINNPLSYVLANLHHLETDVLPRLALGEGERTEVRALLADIRHGAQSSRDIIQQLRVFSHGDKEGRLEPVEVHRVLESSLRMVQHTLRQRARLVREYAPPTLVMANEGKLGQVFMNLLINAAEAIPEGDVEHHEIRLVTRVRAQEVLIEVHDTGAGLTPERRERVFEPFFTSTPSGVDTGLSLSVCRSIVTGLGGRMELESELGRGSTFRVRLPVAERQAVPTTPPPLPLPFSTLPRRGRILIVDDDRMVGVAIRRALQREHEVVVMTEAREALERLVGGEPFDIILCDMMMPEMSGMELHEELSRVSAQVAGRMVFLTGGAFTPRAREFLGRVGNPCMEKPFLPEELRQLVQSLLANWSLTPTRV
ncbi:ATP-binding response regulator [Stigmatella aurantiaca]|uniref:histidine kinase n=1 Tax=Stigmatella aurantiaca (strain DW4/3-1) TaxID=378806 RepID=Q08RT7_STIAD|nr:response regulator [Stigmatella aurantiaca]ADO68257.1 Sensor protein [Stigmatella aurantiaca DW4/3-1]EAU63202.1 histidine kinase [Stigmatella aurantiaca DW4/3-1]